MKVPKAKKLSSGKWYIYLRLGGQGISVTGPDEKTCIRNAQQVKADWLAQKRLPEELRPRDPGPTLTEAIDHYIAKRDQILSPATIRGYRKIQKLRFKSTMSRPISEIRDEEWQQILNDERKLVGGKTIKNAFAFVKSVIRAETKHRIDTDDLRPPKVQKHVTAFLQPEEIPVFVKAVEGINVEVPLLLALSSLRASEIAALRWEDIPPRPQSITVRGAVVRDEHDRLVRKDENKTETSARIVPIMIPALAAAIERDRKPSGAVMTITPGALCERVHRICRKAGITDVPLHGLRHTFASLCYHLRVPEALTMEMGGWSDRNTVHEIYTHLARSDVRRYKTALHDFYVEAAEKMQTKSQT